MILIALSLSWVSSVTVTPLLGALSFKPLARDGEVRRPIPTTAACSGCTADFSPSACGFAGGAAASIVLFAASLLGFTRVLQSFFPPATRPQFMVDVFLPPGTHIRETERFADQIEDYIQSQPGVAHVASFVGGGGLRFLLVYSPESENRAYVQFLVEVDDAKQIDGILATVQQHLDEQHPDANAVAKKFLLGPGAGGRIQARFRGPDPARLREIPDQAMLVLEQDGRTLGCGTTGGRTKCSSGR